MQLVSHEIEYFYQCIMTFWGLRDSKGPILMHQAHLIQNNDNDPERRFVNLFGEFSPLHAMPGIGLAAIECRCMGNGSK